MALADLTYAAVTAALSEFDTLGRDAFLARYGFKAARAYFLESDGRRYDSKAVAGAAHGYLTDNRPLKASEFSGGEQTVAAVLRNLGFEVVNSAEGQPRNPPWSRDELILALDLYMQHRPSIPGQASRPVAELSDLLNRLPKQPGSGSAETFRNPNGVYMKMMNLRRFDPHVAASGQKGLTRGNKDEEIVWNEFSGDPVRLAQVAGAIRKAVLTATDPALPLQDEDDQLAEAAEGKVLTRLHRSRERNRKLVETKKKRGLAQTGRLVCEVCDFDFAERYGERGRGFIEAHHTKPVHTLSEDGKTKLEDLALVCSNCHRMIHSSRPWLSIEELRKVTRRI